MSKIKNYLNCTFSSIFVICILAISLVSASENDDSILNLSSAQEVTSYGPKVSLLENSSLEEDNASSKYERKRKTAIGQWASKHRAELVFSGLAVGTGITALVLNSKVKDLKAEEKKIYTKYMSISEGPEHDQLWSEYEKAHDETEVMVNVRNGFSLATGGITVAIVMSFYIGRP